MQSDIDHNLFKGNAGDDTLFVKFENEVVQDKAKTLEAARPIFKEVPHVSIRAAGSRNFVKRRATQADIARFPRHYAAFKNKEEQQIEGTPLSEWPLVTRTIAKELEALEVRTVEQLVAMSDTACQGFMGIGALRAKAKLYLEQAAGEAPMLKMQAELEARDKTIANQAQQIDMMFERINAIEGAAKKDKPSQEENANEPIAVANPVPKKRASRRKTQ